MLLTSHYVYVCPVCDSWVGKSITDGAFCLLQDSNQPPSSDHMSTDGSEGDPAERIASAKDASTSGSALALILQDGFAEGVISVKEALVYISRRDNR